MNTELLLDEVKKEIKRLQKVVDLLEGSSSRRGRGRGKAKRHLSMKARKAIAAAQRKRWAEVRAKKKQA